MYLITKVPDDITKKLDEVINKKHTEKANHDLAGNIQQEFSQDGRNECWVISKKYCQSCNTRR